MYVNAIVTKKFSGFHNINYARVEYKGIFEYK